MEKPDYNWIDVQKEWPEYEGIYIIAYVYIHEGRRVCAVNSARYDKCNGFTDFDHHYVNGIRYWTMLPEPPNM